MSVFKKTNVNIFAKPTQKTTPDSLYWKKLGDPVLLKEFGPVDYIDFSPLEPHNFVVSSSAKVQIYNPVTKLVDKTFTRFTENAYGASFRKDGLLLCAGSEEKSVKIFKVNDKALLRVFKGHSGAVHRSFFTRDNKCVASFSDDKTVKLWDIAGESEVMQFSAHEDYVRAGSTSPISPTGILSGSYDKKVRLFDARSNQEAVLTLDHGHPVESVVFHPSGGIFLSAGGTEIKVWDAIAGGKLLARFSQHHKTITCLGIASNGSRLVSGSLDRHVKIYDLSSYKPVYSFDFPNSILSLGVSPDNETLAVGMVDGIVSVQRREVESAEEEENKSKRSKASGRYFKYKHTPASNVEFVIKQETKQVQSKHDTYLRKFQYSKALTSVLSSYVTNKTPHVTIALLQELIRRKGLENAIENSDDKKIASLLKFLCKYIGDIRYTPTITDVIHNLLDFHDKRMGSASTEVKELFTKLEDRAREELDYNIALGKLDGVIQMILASSGSS